MGAQEVVPPSPEHAEWDAILRTQAMGEASKRRQAGISSAAVRQAGLVAAFPTLIRLALARLTDSELADLVRGVQRTYASMPFGEKLTAQVRVVMATTLDRGFRRTCV